MTSKFLMVAVAAMSSAALAEGGGEGLAEQKSYNVWHFRIGPVMSPRVRVNMRAPHFATPLMPKGNYRSGGADSGAAADPSEGYATRQYVDGYVNPDAGTEDPDTMVSGLTWFWGANDVAAQYANGRMEFHSGVTRWEESVSSSSYSIGSGYESDRDTLIGVEAVGGWTFFNNRTFDAAVDAGFRFYGSGNLESALRYGTSVTTTRNEYRFVDSYDASGWSEVPSGAHEGTLEGPGRLIGAMPTRREELAGSSSTTEEHTYSGNTKLNYRIWDLRVGPTLGWQVTDWFAVRGGVYGLLGLVDATLKTDGILTDGRRSASSSTCGAVFGLAFGVFAQFDLTDSIFLTGGVEYDWWADSVGLNAGGAEAEIELSDISISLGLGVEF